MAMTLNYLLLNLNSTNETLLSVLYFSTYDCVLVLFDCVVIFKIFLLRFVYCMICNVYIVHLLLQTCATDMCIINFYLLTYLLT